MSIFIILLCILVLVLLITWGKVNPFLAFLVVSIGAGLALGIPLENVAGSVQKGIGGLLGDLVIVIGLGAMLGKLVAESGAAQKISQVLMNSFGEKNIQWALMATGFVVGIPLFYNVGFVLLVPLIFSVTYQYKLPAVYIGIPMLAALSVTHGFLPPHPSPAALVGQLNADMGLTLLYGFIVAVPTIIVAGPIFARTLKGIDSKPLATFQAKPLPDDQLPSGFTSFFSALLPVVLLASAALLNRFGDFSGGTAKVVSFFSDATIVMIISLAVATYSIGLAYKKKMSEVMGYYTEAIKDVAPILLIVGGAGALKQVFSDSGVSVEIGALLQNMDIHPLILGWMIAAFIRVCIGSATVAGLTSAGILAPIMPQLGVDPNLMVLAVGAGSLMFSHVNDSGFWMYKEYFNVSIKDTILSWSLMETVVSVVGMAVVLLIDLFI
ncbi:gluconate:H+ symporter [uncultured Imperialibacter sp.]|uniref:gluconate:H+ symporter n=1 Tax=uncultured Imperialibacter sp. TaxID=1672639 RepID=UPI0030DC0617|tara:strand:+ start:164749 stop:166062 length:1314 start_codon:yes stop_codon:yes gene_type:complete